MMITRNQLRYFKRIRCWKNEFQNLEAYDRWGSTREKQEKLSVRQMERIILLLYGLQLLDEESHYVSDEFRTAFSQLLETECQDQETLQELKKITKKGLWKRIFKSL